MAKKTKKHNQRKSKRTAINQDDKVLGKMLNGIRLDAGLTQSELANSLSTQRQVPVTQNQVSLCISGRRRVTATEVKQWCDSCGVNVHTFLRSYYATIEQVDNA